MLAALGRGIARRPGLIVVGWLILTIAAFAAATGVFGESLFARLEAGDATVSSESSEGRAILSSASTAGASLSLITQDADPNDPALVEPITTARQDLLAIEGMATVVDPLIIPGGPAAPAAAGLIAKDRNGFLVSATLEPDLPEDIQDASLDATQQRLTELSTQIAQVIPGSSGQVGGGTLLFTAITGQVEKDLVRGELIALPISLLVMVLVFGGFLAAGMPIVGAIASIGGGLVTLLGFSYLIDLDAAVVNVVTVLALGLCIDYGLLIVSRYREELRSQLAASKTRSTKQARTDALVSTMATAGRTVMFSGVTVAISLSGLLLFEARILRAVGAAGVSVVVVALLVALTLVP
ncbi:MAG: MMPL family transporter, partial [Nakamurella sp.]